jgi:hypothetical protein
MEESYWLFVCVGGEKDPCAALPAFTLQCVHRPRLNERASQTPDVKHFMVRYPRRDKRNRKEQGEGLRRSKDTA